jgi:hypothetical protein
MVSVRKDPNLVSAAKKMRRFDGRVYTGMLTPAEALALCANGAKPTGNPELSLRAFRHRRDRGYSYPTPIYVTLRGAALREVERWAYRNNR